MSDISILENIIVGRVDPHIYAFTTGTVPNYLKVGDTYRPVSVRLKEWKEYFPDLEKQYEKIAKVDDDIYFRDFAIHFFLENEKRRIRLQQTDLPDGIYYSKEFFKEATTHDIVEAVEDITKDYLENGGKYQFYSAETRLAETFTYARTESYEPRPNQQDTICRFKAAVDAGRTNLLMYAVMRFGKSFTSMCCAVEMGADIVTIVSAKADVKEEWKKAVESHTKFADYVFIDGSALLANDNIIKETLADGKKAAIFLTLQDLQGDEIKEKHKEVFENQIDLLIVDETHFGARAEKYGQVLRELGKDGIKAQSHKKDFDDFVEASEADEQIEKVLKPRIRLHLSGTPYRILMGSEFSKDDIIAFYQFSDIVKDQEAWDKEHVLFDDVKEWDNPYYGFPQMIRFAFNPNESSRQRLKELKESGVSFAFSALLKPKSVKKADDSSHKKFVFEQEVLDLLEVIDGSKEDDELLGFLDYDKIKDGNMCRHIVMVLPYCASCDAMEALIRSNPDKFRNLNDYEIVNISGLDVPRELGDPQKIKSFIHHCEEEGKKTLTLTVNRMLTGSTVEEWDTMLFLKDTASPQEYDQAIFRLQNQYIKKYVDDDGNVIKYNMKPQTLLVDFEPGRMFSMQEQKAQIYNVNVDDAGNSKLEERLKEELRISPIIVMNSDKMEQVQAADILNAVSEYSKSRGVAEETLEIPVDLSLMEIEVIRKAIERENELGSKAGLTIKATEGDGTDMDTGDDGSDAGSAGGEETHEPGDDTGGTDTTSGTDEDEKKNDPTKQFRSYYARILFFAFLTRDTVISLEDIISKIETEDNARIAKHIGISKPVLESIQNNINKFILRDLDYKIHNLNKLSNDTSVNPLERATVAVHKFGKLGESEVITPKNICDDMVTLVPDDGFTGAVENGHKVLDIAGKAGEFALAIYERFAGLGYGIDQIKDTIYTIPTSGLTYEFTRMIYEILGLNVANIADKFNDYDLLKIKDDDDKVDYEKICAILTQNKPFNEITINDEIVEGDEKVNFDVVVGNPPYQEQTIGDNKGFAPPIYNEFLECAYCVSKLSIMIHPARFLFNAGSTPKEWNKKMLESNHIYIAKYESDATKVFPDTAITGGVAITVCDKDSCYDPIEVYVPYDELNRIRKKVTANEFVSISGIMSGRTPYLFTNALHTDFPNAKDRLSNGHMYDVSSNAFQSLPEVFSTEEPQAKNDYYRVLGRLNNNRTYGWIKKQYVRGRSDSFVGSWKVFLPKANGASGMLGDQPARLISKPVIGEPNDIATDTFICVGAFESEDQVNALNKYICCKFSRALLGVLKVTQDNSPDKWNYVPMQDFSKQSDIDWTKSISEIDSQLYTKYHLSEDEIAFIEAKVAPLEQ